MGFFCCCGFTPADDACSNCETDTTPAQMSVDGTGIKNNGCLLCATQIAKIHICDQINPPFANCDWQKDFATVDCGGGSVWGWVRVLAQFDGFSGPPYFLRIWWYKDGAGTPTVEYEKEFSSAKPDCSIAHTLTKVVDNDGADCTWPATMPLEAV